MSRWQVMRGRGRGGRYPINFNNGNRFMKRKFDYNEDMPENNYNKRRRMLGFPNDYGPIQYSNNALPLDGRDSRPHTFTNSNTERVTIEPPNNHNVFQTKEPTKRCSLGDRLKDIRTNNKPYKRSLNLQNNGFPNNSEFNSNRQLVNRNTWNNNNEGKRISDIPAVVSVNDRLKRIQTSQDKTSSSSNSNEERRIRYVKPTSLEERLKSIREIQNINTDNAVTPIKELTANLEDVTSFANLETVPSLPSSDLNIEYMECSTADDEEVFADLQNLRKITNEKTTFEPDTHLQEIIASAAKDLVLNKELLKSIFIVVDTNIFISHLKLIKQLMEIELNGVVKPIILVPWMVIQELDYLKEGKSGDKLKAQARAAVYFINDQLSSKSDLLRGQSVNDALKINAPSVNADDGVLRCAMQVVENGELAYLLTNDVNLRNKAMINNIAAYSSQNVIKKIMPFAVDNSINKPTSSPNLKCEVNDNIKSHLSHLFSLIILTEIKNVFGTTWNRYISTPPWTLKGCLQLFQKHWIAVFSFNLQKQCESTIDKFLQLLSMEYAEDNDIFKKKLVENSLDFCLYLKNGYPQHLDGINECVSFIDKYKNN